MTPAKVPALCFLSPSHCVCKLAPSDDILVTSLVSKQTLSEKELQGIVQISMNVSVRLWRSALWMLWLSSNGLQHLSEHMRRFQGVKNGHKMRFIRPEHTFFPMFHKHSPWSTCRLCLHVTLQPLELTHKKTQSYFCVTSQMMFSLFLTLLMWFIIMNSNNNNMINIMHF